MHQLFLAESFLIYLVFTTTVSQFSFVWVSFVHIKDFRCLLLSPQFLLLRLKAPLMSGLQSSTAKNLPEGIESLIFSLCTECETEYNAVKTVECYQRLLEKDGQRIVVFDTLGTPGAYAVINRMAEDNVVLAQYGYGRTDGADGRVWPWVFNAASHYWSQIAVKMKFMAEQEGGVDKMKGKKKVQMKIHK